MNRRFIPTLFLFCFALCLTTSVPVFAENLLDVVETVQTAIEKKYPNKDSLARKMAMEELEKIAKGDMSDTQIINAILEKFPEFSAGLSPVSDVNSNGIPDEWEKEKKVSAEYSSPDSDQDSDGFSLLQEYRAKTDPADPLSHPKYITQVFVSGISQQRFPGLELVAVDRSKPDKKDWVTTFNVIRNNRKRTEFIRINVGTFKNNNIDFSLVDVEVDEKNGDPVAYIQRVGKTERIPCRPKQPVYDPGARVRLHNALFDREITSLVGNTFKLGTEKSGEESYKVLSADLATKKVVVESVGEKPETITLTPVQSSSENGETAPQPDPSENDPFSDPSMQ